MQRFWRQCVCPLDAYAALAQERFIPDCAGHVEIARASVMRVEQNGALILSRWPRRAAGRHPLAGPDGGPRYLAERRCPA